MRQSSIIFFERKKKHTHTPAHGAQAKCVIDEIGLSTQNSSLITSSRDDISIERSYRSASNKVTIVCRIFIDFFF